MKLINSTMQKFFMPGNPAAAVKTHLLTQRQADIIKLIKSTDISLPPIGREVGVQNSYFASSFLANRKKRFFLGKRRQSKQYLRLAAAAVIKPLRHGR